MRLNVALLQLTSTGDIRANITTIEAMVRQAAEQGAQLIALPENAFYMREEGRPLERFFQSEHPGVQAACEWAKAYGVWVLIGSVALIPEQADDARLSNRSLLINGDGRVVHAYNKIHLFDVDVGDGQPYCESERICPGAEAVLADTPWGDIGMTVCYDVRFPHLYRALAKRGASILAMPAAFTEVTGRAHWHVLLRARAIENGCFVIAPAQCGTHPGGRRTYGHSLVIDPWGRVLGDAGEKPCILQGFIDLSEVERVRKSIPSLAHDRPFR